MGIGFDPRHRHGAAGLARSSCNRVCSYLEVGHVAKAPRLVAGGKRWAARDTSSSRPCWSTRKTNMKVVQEEIFGPVVAAMPFDDPEEAAAAANDSDLRPGRGGLDPRHRQGPPHRQHSCAPERSGSTATTSSTRRCRSAATSSRAGAARWARTFSISTRRPRRSARDCRVGLLV